jgi:hypothetical protein
MMNEITVLEHCIRLASRPGFCTGLAVNSSTTLRVNTSSTDTRSLRFANVGMAMVAMYSGRKFPLPARL